LARSGGSAGAIRTGARCTGAGEAAGTGTTLDGDAGIGGGGATCGNAGDGISGGTTRGNDGDIGAGTTRSVGGGAGAGPTRGSDGCGNDAGGDTGIGRSEGFGASIRVTGASCEGAACGGTPIGVAGRGGIGRLIAGSRGVAGAIGIRAAYADAGSGMAVPGRIAPGRSRSGSTAGGVVESGGAIALLLAIGRRLIATGRPLVNAAAGTAVLPPGTLQFTKCAGRASARSVTLTAYGRL
jgi:hypothetical protein